jgi:SAM-dependent methyltransferase
MGFFKLSKQQLKDNQMIDAWLDGEPFKMNSRDKSPTVPNLTPWEVRRRYTPLYPQDTGQFFSPQRIAKEFADFVAHSLCIDVTGKIIVEPSAGLAALVEWTKDFAEKVVCYEADRKLVEIGRKIEPWIEWVNTSPFDPEYAPSLEGQFDLVLANPPYGTDWAMLEAESYCQSGAKRSEHRFLELAIRALKPGGMAVFIAPVNFVEKMPKAMKAWAEQNFIIGPSRPVEGQFDLTKVNTAIFAFQKPMPKKVIPLGEYWQLTKNEFRRWAEKGGYLGNELTLETADALHRSTVEKAIEAGKPVLSKVLADYPDLSPRYSPLHQHYIDLKAEHPDGILFFLLGDFFETFDDDAETIARELDIPLTSRPVGVNLHAQTAGVPCHAIQNFAPLLIKKGHQVLIAEHTNETPKNGMWPRTVAAYTAPITAAPEPEPIWDDSQGWYENGKLYTVSGRNISLPPMIRTDSGSGRKITNDIAKLDKWLVEQGIVEAEARGDSWNRKIFASLNPRKLATADREGLNMYTFGTLGYDDIRSESWQRKPQAPAPEPDPEPAIEVDWAVKWDSVFSG